MFDYRDIKEKGKETEDDDLLNEFFIGNKHLSGLKDYVETENYFYYLSDEKPTLLFRVTKDDISTYTIIGFSLSDDKDKFNDRTPRIVVDKRSTFISVYNSFSDHQPVIRSSFDFYTGTWDVRYDVYRYNEPSNMRQALQRLKNDGLDNEGYTEKTIYEAQRVFEELRKKSQKRKIYSPNA